MSHKNTIKVYAGDVYNVDGLYDGWIGLSLAQENENHIKHDMRNKLPFEDNSIDAFQSEDVFEHIEYNLLPQIINDIYRVLKPKALFRLSLPDYRCDILRRRSLYDFEGNLIYDPFDGGTDKTPGHLWFPMIESVRKLLESTKFHTHGSTEYLHFYEIDGTPITKSIDYSLGMIRRTPDNDDRVKNPYRPMSIVVDMHKGRE